MKEVSIYTDGACSGNPGKGGYGTILVYNGREKELSEGYVKTTNNRMELMALIVGLEALKEDCKVAVYSDSKYVTEALNQGWLLKWIANGWKLSNKKPVQNIDLWKRYLEAKGGHSLSVHWVKGHDGNEINERCDRLAVGAYGKDGLKEDKGYQEE